MKRKALSKPSKLYRIDILIEERAVKMNQNSSDIKRQLQRLLGITPQHMAAIRRATSESTGFLNTSQLIKIAEYFGCDISDLINKNLQASNTGPGAGVSSPGAGTFSQNK